MQSFVTRLFVSVVLFATALLAILSGEFAAPYQYVPMFIPLIVIHYWAIRRPAVLPSWLVFLIGIWVDVLSDGPIGYWALMYLAVFAFGISAQAFRHTGVFGRFAVFFTTALGLSVFAWVVQVVYTLQSQDIQPFFVAAFGAAVLYPVVSGLMRVFNRDVVERANGHMTRGANA